MYNSHFCCLVDLNSFLLFQKDKIITYSSKLYRSFLFPRIEKEDDGKLVNLPEPPTSSLLDAFAGFFTLGIDLPLAGLHKPSTSAIRPFDVVLAGMTVRTVLAVRTC